MKSSIIFKTERLHVRSLDLNDNDAFFDLKNNPKVMNPLPRKVLNKIENDQELIMLIESTKSTNKKVWSICVKHNNELIGCCGFMKNDQNNDEIGYQLRELYWGKGFGTEIARGLIEYGFTNMNSTIITADVNSENKASIKILNQLMTFEKEFYNHNDKCFDQRYFVQKNLFQ